jgi:sarcosine oxidase, subunit alpha
VKNTRDAPRLPAGGRVDRNRPLTFWFNGRRYQGLAGDTLASALLANGVRLVGRSFKYHRPRGVLTAGIGEPNALVQLTGSDDEPNVPATGLELREGLQARSANCWPSARWDFGVINDCLHTILPAGFYYKTFLWPIHGWNFYARWVRRAAGIGRAPRRYDTGERYEKRYHHCDVLIVGAGPAGIAAALAAAHSGARVMLVDDQKEAGGQLLNYAVAESSTSVMKWVQATVEQLARMCNVVHLQQASAAGYYDHNMVYVVERSPADARLTERLWRVRARRVVLATGAMERPLAFSNNDRPGIMLASAAAAYVHRYAVRPGREAVIITNNDSAYDSAATLARGGVQVNAIVDIRRAIPDARLRAVRSLGIEVMSGYTVTAVRGRVSVKGIEVAPVEDVRRSHTIRCDLVGMSGGWSPTLQLHAQAGGKPKYNAHLAAFIPGASAQAEQCVGAAAGHFGIAKCIEQGSLAGSTAAGELGLDLASAAVRADAGRIDPWPYGIEATWEMPGDHRRSRAFLDFGHDVTTNDVRLALRENYESVELVKRYTTAGMAVDQGKIGNVNTIGFVASVKGSEPGSVGTTTFRPPYEPVSFNSWAGIDRGEIIVPARRTPITPWFEQCGAYFDEAGGLFRRPFHIPLPNEAADAAVNREALAVRNAVGIYDGTPLGKFELNGPDVVTLLNRVYANRWDSLQVGMGRFGWMLREDGRLFDDGVTFRLGPQHYLMSTGSGAADAVHAHLERLLQREWPDLRVFVTPVTEQWANLCVCGPLARELLRGAGTDIDLRAEAFPFMGFRSGRVAGFDVRVARVSYTGELSFEVNVRSRDGLALWEALLTAGKPHGITPVGSSTSLLLRLEKGFVAAWAEGDGYLTPSDAGLEWAINHDKGDFIGKRSLIRDRNAGGTRPQIVGLLPVDSTFVPPDGAPLIDAHAAESARIIGLVTAGGFSPNMGRSIALAQLDNGRSRHGEHVTISTVGRKALALVTEPVFVDPSGSRMKA